MLETTLNFALYDVFADEPFSGCPAAVVRAPNAQPQSVLTVLAQEFNFPETCVYWWEGDVVEAQFATSAGPIAACGHGLLAVLADATRTSVCQANGELHYRVVDGAAVQARFCKNDERTSVIKAKWHRWPEIGPPLPVGETAMLLGVSEDCLCKDLPLTVVNSGILNGLVPIVDERTLMAIQPTYGQDWLEYFTKHKLADLHLYVLQDPGPSISSALRLRTRNLFPYGVREEAATGTASVSLAAALKETLFSDVHRFSFTQGMHRFGSIQVCVRAAPSGQLNLWLEGTVVLVAVGTELASPRAPIG